jgi:hypothetical protein
MNETSSTVGKGAEPDRPPKRPRESLKARQAFNLYCELREARSLKEVARRLGKHKSQMAGWSVVNGWSERVAAYDAELENKAVEAAAVADQAAADKWEQRRQESLEKKYTDGEQYEDQGKNMRIFPITEVRRVVEVDETGRETQVQIIKPARWTKRDALRFTQAGQAMKEAAIRNAAVRRPSQIREVDTFEDVPLEPSEKEPQ